MRWLYLLTMRYAPAILLVLALLDGILCLLTGVTVIQESGRTLSLDANGSQSLWWLVPVVGKMLSPVFKAISLPLLGAAALWRFDRWASADRKEAAD